MVYVHHGRYAALLGPRKDRISKCQGKVAVRHLEGFGLFLCALLVYYRISKLVVHFVANVQQVR